ncbi:MAG TPA: hypothetical protein PKY59_20020 [Pyrinomonadaceae bacterium]|nr:hypothetical protein [Pyrinomonadaceae bacterium]
MNKPSNINTSPTKKPINKPENSSTNTNSNSNSTNTEPNSENSNLQPMPKPAAIKIDRLEIEPNSHTAYPFTVESETAKIVGKIEVSNGEKLIGYVFTQEAFDEHFPDETYKMFSFEGDKTIEIEQTLVKEKYVIVFINENEKSVVIEGNIEIN